MSKPHNSIPITGTGSGINLYKHHYEGTLTLPERSLPEETLLPPSFAAVRRNNIEFRQSVLAGQLIRQAFRGMVRCAGDNQLNHRLVACLQTVVKSDALHLHGERRVANGDLGLLHGFNFNSTFPLPAVLVDAHELQATGEGHYSLYLPAFTPGDSLAVPEGATHVQVHSSLAILHFEQRLFKADHQAPAVWPLQQAIPAQTIAHFCVHQAGGVRLHMLGIAYYMQTAAGLSPLPGRNGQAAALLHCCLV